MSQISRIIKASSGQHVSDPRLSRSHQCSGLCLYHLFNKVTGNDENLSLSVDPGPRRGCCSVTLPWPRSAQTEQKSVDVRTLQRDIDAILRQQTAFTTLSYLIHLSSFSLAFELSIESPLNHFLWMSL